MSLPDWKTIRWNFDGHQGSIPTDLSRYVAMLVEGNSDEREDARDLFFQWPVESARYIGQLGAIPSFLSVLFGVIDEEKLILRETLNWHPALFGGWTTTKH